MGRAVKKTRKKIKKWIDGSARGAVASRAATSEGGRETGCRSWCCFQGKSPDRLFSPLEGRIFDSVAQHGTCQKREADRWKQRHAFKAWDDISPENAGKRKKIELCAARRIEARGKQEAKSCKGSKDGECRQRQETIGFLRRV